MTQPGAAEAKATIDEVAANADRLGLTWRMRPATVTSGTSAANLTALATIDGDVNSTKIISVIGMLAVGDRVMTTTVPPQGIYATGWLSPLFSVAGAGAGLSDASVRAVFTGGSTTTSATFVSPLSAGVAVTFPFTKSRTVSRVAYTFACSLYSDVANTSVAFGLQIGGTDYPTAFMFINPAVTHTQAAAAGHLTGIAAGSYTVTVRWRRAAGGGVLNVNSDDLVTVRLQEVL